MLDLSAGLSSSDRVRDIVELDRRMLMVLNRFRIPFGFGNSSIEDVCSNNKIDCATFLAVANLICGHEASSLSIHLPTLVAYLKEAHTAILDFSLTGIRDFLIRGVCQQQLDDPALFIIKFFDEYMDEVRSHMAYEDNFVFPYIDQLQSGVRNPDFSIRDFATKHNSMTSKLNEVKDIFLQHYVLPNTRMLNRALTDIMECGEDLISHCRIENNLLVPAVERLERTTSRNGRKSDTDPLRPDSVSIKIRYEALSDREKEIIRLVAQGLSNKEIADRLCLSFHTVTTYRKNLSAKLNIHSTAALTIFAILHNIINPKEIDLK